MNNPDRVISALMPDGKTLNTNIIENIQDLFNEDARFIHADIISTPCKPIISERDLDTASKQLSQSFDRDKVSKTLYRLTETILLQQKIISRLWEEASNSMNPIVITLMNPEHRVKSPHGDIKTNVCIEDEDIEELIEIPQTTRK